jgi:glutamyl-tRNA synthetase
MEKRSPVRVRFAPSPTGALHIGGARTALFNFLFARRHGGSFLLRIEDTDRVRSSDAMVRQILNSLSWLGLAWDEEPVFQSTRIDRYLQVCRLLREKGHAYPCFCSAETLQEKREAALKATGEYRYDGACRLLPEEDVRRRLESGEPHALRFRMTEGAVVFTDHIRGEVTVQTREMDDFIILRSDSTPVYQTAVVVDDHDMEITHVIRGDDHLSNTPKQILLYQALGWPVPEFAHVPMILGPDKKRLSKRHGATSVEEYRENGYLSPALVNFLALLGWSPDDNREIITLREMTAHFSLKGISGNPAVFDETKLAWMNGEYISRTSAEDLFDPVVRHLKVAGLVEEKDISGNRSYILRYIDLLKGRMRRLTDFTTLGYYFFRDPESYEEKAKDKYWLKEPEQVSDRMVRLLSALKSLDTWKETILEKTIRDLSEEMGVGAGKLIHPVRLAITGFGVSPGLFELMEALGKERVIRRIEKALDSLRNL